MKAVLISVLMLFTFSSVASAQPHYRLVDLGEAIPSAINRYGAMAGVLDDHAVLIKGGSTLDLGTLGGAVSQATGLNSTTIVVGGAADATGTRRPFLWTSQKGMVAPPTPTGSTDASAIAINNTGLIVGYARTDTTTGSTSVALRWNQGTMQILFGGSVPAWASAVNNAGLIGGNVGVAATLWNPDGTMTTLDTFGGINASVAHINDAGVVLVNISFADTFAALLWRNGAVLLDLEPISGAFGCGGRGLNRCNWTVGECTVDTSADFPTIGVLWRSDGVALDLNTLVDNLAGWRLITASAINDAGLMTGEMELNGVTHGFLLVPQVPVSASAME